jgi:hypothetical protein
MRREGLGVVPDPIMHIALHWVANTLSLAIFAPVSLAIPLFLPLGALLA